MSLNHHKSLSSILRDKSFWLLLLGIMVIFAGRTWLAVSHTFPHLFDILDGITVLGALGVVIKYDKTLKKWDWFTAVLLGIFIAMGMYFATLYRAYPVFGIARNRLWIALIRGTYTAVASLGGIAVMRLGGPVQFHFANQAWDSSWYNVRLGILIGLPLAVVNVFTLQMSLGQPITWQSPMAALLDALQPGIFEEIIYRLALLGLFWLILSKSLPEQASWLAAVLAMLVHNFMHFDDLFIQNPLSALGMGVVTSILWGVPLMILSLRKGLDSAIAFHWIQDVTRFLTGF
jgi:hypothetical protein